jgi:hypothetical protein
VIFRASGRWSQRVAHRESNSSSGCLPITHHYSKEGSSDKLWKDLCERHGKRKEILLEQAKYVGKSYFDLYRRIPCVPEDFPTIAQALDFCAPGGTITLLPGIYNERIEVSKSVKICAADPVRGAALVWYRKESFRKDQCAIAVEDDCELFVMQDLKVLHFSRGADIWSGNCAIYCNGPDTTTHIERCSIQSDSGRGICVGAGASLRMNESTVHDCAATGVYVCDADSVCEISNCNILRNGFGTRTGPYEGISQIVPPGQSGLYIEVGEADITNSLVAENCLNGMSVIQHGAVHISGCDFAGNGQAPIVVSDNPLSPAEGGVYERDNRFDLVPNRKETMRCPQVHHDLLTLSKVHQAFPYRRGVRVRLF